MFVQQFPIDHVTAGTTDAVEGEIDRGGEAQRRRQRLGYLMTAAIGVPLVGLAAYLISSARRPASASDLTPTTSASAPFATSASPDASPSTSASPSARPATVASNGRATTVPVSTNAGASAAAGAGAGAAGAPASPIKGGGTALATSDPLRIAINAAGPCWIRVKGDGAVRYQGLLQAGDKQSAESQNTLELLIGDAGQFRFSINGRPGRSLGKSGEVVVARITRENVQTWLQQ
jgi:Domain of unknown function (DUF4115)